MTQQEILSVTKDVKLLYVEDDMLLRESSTELFKTFFTNIDVAVDGLEALELYNKNTYELIITDVLMPKLNGIEFIKQVRKNNLTIPIIVFSALNDATSITSCISLNVDAYLLKPLVLNNFLDALEKITLKIIHNNSRKSPLLLLNTMQETLSIDTLTNLKSHNALLESMEKLSPQKTPVLILINIDDFHVYNEIYGLKTGDLILTKFAALLTHYTQDTHYELYRVSGDEFVLYEVVDMIDPELYIIDIEKIISYVETHPIHLPELLEPIHLSVTIGVSFDAQNSYGKADMALQEARRRGRQYLGYNIEADRREELKKSLYWKEEVNRALQENRVHTYYQSIVDKDREVIKYEALARLHQLQEDGSTEIITPHQCLDYSKVSRQYIALTKIVIQESFNTMIKENVHVSINLSFHDIANKEISNFLHEYIKNTTSNPKQTLT